MHLKMNQKKKSLHTKKRGGRGHRNLAKNIFSLAVKKEGKTGVLKVNGEDICAQVVSLFPSPSKHDWQSIFRLGHQIGLSFSHMEVAYSV